MAKATKGMDKGEVMQYKEMMAQAKSSPMKRTMMKSIKRGSKKC